MHPHICIHVETVRHRMGCTSITRALSFSRNANVKAISDSTGDTPARPSRKPPVYAGKSRKLFLFAVANVPCTGFYSDVIMYFEILLSRAYMSAGITSANSSK